MANSKVFLAIAYVLLSLYAIRRPANALPVFAHRYGLSCEVCHTTVPHLNAFGQAFRDRGFQLNAARQPLSIPIAAKFNLVYSSA